MVVERRVFLGGLIAVAGAVPGARAQAPAPSAGSLVAATGWRV
jgi:hypothetical protein